MQFPTILQLCIYSGHWTDSYVVDFPLDSLNRTSQYTNGSYRGGGWYGKCAVYSFK